MGVIKSVLKEELENAIKLKKEYEEKIKEYPGGTFIQKDRGGNKYYYLAYRNGDKVKFVYKGKKISKEDKEKLKKDKRLRRKYKEQIKKLKKRIKYLRKILRGKEEV